MARLTNWDREQLTRKLIKPKKDELAVMAKEIHKDLEELYISKAVPKEVMMMFKEHPKYFSKMQVYTRGKLDIPPLNAPSKGGYSIYLDDVNWVSKKANKKIEAYNAEASILRENRQKIEKALKMFTTTAKLRDGFPEAFELLDEKPDKVNPPAIIITDIQSWLKK